MGQQTTESVYAKPESICPSRVSYYASSQLTQVKTTTNNKKAGSRDKRENIMETTLFFLG